MFLIMREALAGGTRFSEFRSVLSIASDVLTTRLNVLVDGGVLVRGSYREPGQRTRASYHLTAAAASSASSSVLCSSGGTCTCPATCRG